MNQFAMHLRRLNCAPLFRVLLKSLASVTLAIVLLLALSAVLAWGTLLEASHGPEYAHATVYTSNWFLILLGLLALNILAAMLARLPWRREHFGFVITHGGLLVLLGGALLTFLAGVEGKLVLEKGKSGEEWLVADRSVINIVHSGGQRQISTELTFSPGPVDWADGRTLDFGQSRGLSVKVVKFVRHATRHVAWVADETRYEGPALRLRLDGPHGDPVAEDWLAGTIYGGEAVIGPTGYQIWPLQVPSMLQDLLQPPTEELGSVGILSMHYEGKMHRMRVDGSIGKIMPLGDSGVQIEITAYYPDARPKPDGGFYSRSERPRNPLLELQVHVPGQQTPLRQVAFAKRPLLVMDGVTGHVCPVRFWYHHPELTPTPGADFAQLPDGRLYCRATVNASHAAPQEVKAGDQIPLGSQFRLSILEYIPRARRAVSFLPTRRSWAEGSEPEAAALLEIDLDAARHEIWLRRNDPEYGFKTLWTDRGPVMITFDYQRQPLGYCVKLLECVHDVKAGQTDRTTIASHIQIVDTARNVSQQHEISMNHPLTYGKFTLYQSTSPEVEPGKPSSVLLVAYDPGQLLKYLGSALICAGMILTFGQRVYTLGGIPHAMAGSSGDLEVDDAPPPTSAVPEPLGRAWCRSADLPTSTSRHRLHE